MSEPRGAGGDVVRSSAGVGELGWRGGVEWVWVRRWVGMGVDQQRWC